MPRRPRWDDDDDDFDDRLRNRRPRFRSKSSGVPMWVWITVPICALVLICLIAVLVGRSDKDRSRPGDHSDLASNSNLSADPDDGEWDNFPPPGVGRGPILPLPSNDVMRTVIPNMAGGWESLVGVWTGRNPFGTPITYTFGEDRSFRIQCTQCLKPFFDDGRVVEIKETPTRDGLHYALKVTGTHSNGMTTEWSERFTLTPSGILVTLNGNLRR